MAKSIKILTGLSYPFVCQYVGSKIKKRGKAVTSWLDIDIYVSSRPDKLFLYYMLLLEMGKEVQQQIQNLYKKDMFNHRNISRFYRLTDNMEVKVLRAKKEYKFKTLHDLCKETCLKHIWIKVLKDLECQITFAVSEIQISMLEKKLKSLENT